MKLRWSNPLHSASILQIITPSPEMKIVSQESHLSFSFQKRRGFGFIQRTICANTEPGLFSYFACILPPSSLLMLFFFLDYQKFLWSPHYFTHLFVPGPSLCRSRPQIHTYTFSEKKLSLECSNVRWFYCIPLLISFPLRNALFWEKLFHFSLHNLVVSWFYSLTASHCSDHRDWFKEENMTQLDPKR